MVVVMLSAVLLPLLGAVVGACVRRARAVRRRRRQRWPNASWATESSALRLRLNGTLNKKQYRTIVEAIAARDDVDRPLSLPLR